jgi:Arc/MetJ-type ribon-helix-helix transcriptional regulator
MTINVKPETEQLVQKEIQNGHFQSVDEIIVEGVQAWRERHRSKQIGSEQRRKAVEQALAFAKDRAIPLGGISIKEMIHAGCKPVSRAAFMDRRRLIRACCSQAGAVADQTINHGDEGVQTLISVLLSLG